MRGLSAATYLVFLLALFALAPTNLPLWPWIIASLAAGAWLSWDVHRLAHRVGEHLLEVTALVNIGLIVVLGFVQSISLDAALFLAGIANVVYGVGFIEARELAPLSQTVGAIEVVAGVCFFVGYGSIAAVLAIPSTIIAYLILRGIGIGAERKP